MFSRLECHRKRWLCHGCWQDKDLQSTPPWCRINKLQLCTKPLHHCACGSTICCLDWSWIHSFHNEHSQWCPNTFSSNLSHMVQIVLLSRTEVTMQNLWRCLGKTPRRTPIFLTWHAWSHTVWANPTSSLGIQLFFCSCLFFWLGRSFKIALHIELLCYILFRETSNMKPIWHDQIGIQRAEFGLTAHSLVSSLFKLHP